MSWSRQGDLYTLVEKKKRELGKIPEETCPLIDSVIKVLDTPDATPEMLEAIKTLELLRTDNGRLRDLGKEWYGFCEELCSEADEIIEDLEEENEISQNEVRELKRQLEISLV